ncbi:MAG: polysaccharide deacetylase family protein [Puia sp.]|nr:polysaccharide deacetylase family protein [Puia sp.]
MKKNFVIFSAALLAFTFTACGSGTGSKNPASATTATPSGTSDSLTATRGNTGDSTTASGAPGTAQVPAGNIADAATILARKQVPILCYHQIRDWKPTDSKNAKPYIIPPAVLREQLKMLHDSGYHTILPDQLYAYLTTGAALPSKPVMLTFDDTDMDQYTVAFPEMKKYGFKGVFFIMTVSLGRLPHYMTKEQVREISDAGNTIGSHTWDHHNVKKYQGQDWVIQIEKPTKQLEAITGKPIRYFAYPFGLWNTAAIPELKKRGFIAAFQLSDKMDSHDPLYTIRRIIVPGTWSLQGFRNNLVHDF